MIYSYSRRTALTIFLSAMDSAFLLTASQAQVTQPERGTALRANILDALRPVVQAEIGGDIEFVVNDLRVLGDWAYVNVRPQRPGGGAIDWRTTKFREGREAGAMSDLVLALLRREAVNWRVVECVIGPTDVAWEGWIEPHRLQRKLFSDE
jgi:hypothetical protein